MGDQNNYDVIIIGGGLAGLTSAIHLGSQGVAVLLIEKYKYPYHKVCGEYLSNEVLPYLKYLGLDALAEGAVPISKFFISTHNGRKIETKLPLGGFGMSRYTLDELLFKIAKKNATILFDTVKNIQFGDDAFTVVTSDKKKYSAKYVVGAYGKRSNLDKELGRKFIQKKSPWLAVKSHYSFQMEENLVALHNFRGGYCGLSRIETGAVNCCYLATYKSFKEFGDVAAFQREVMSKNPYLKQFFEQSESRFDAPLTISQVNFDKKKPVENHVFMIGDSAGLIHPLCGNGMAMAIHSAKMFSELFLKNFKSNTPNRNALEKSYTLEWNTQFKNRMRTGRLMQHLLLHPNMARLGFYIGNLFPALVPKLIKKTHGKRL